MADKEININVKATADKGPIVDLANEFENLHEKTEEATESMEKLDNSVQNITSDNLDDVATAAENGTASIDEESDAIDNATGSMENLGSASNDTADAVDDIKKDPVDDLGDSADETASKFNDLMDSILAADDATSMIDALAGAQIGGELVSGYTSMADAAGGYSDTMVRLGYALSDTSMTVEQVEQKYGSMISSMTEATGRGAGNARNHIINMANVGIKNEEILSNSFEGISKAAFQMGKDFDQVDRKFQTIALSGMMTNRTLRDFGLAVEDVASVMGVSVDEAKDKFKELDSESRAAILSTALNMKYGSDVTENYKNSYQHLNEELQRAKDYFIRTVGEALLPYVIPAINTAADLLNFLTQGFKNLPAPLQTAIGGFLTLTTGLTALGMGFKVVTKLISFALSPYVKLIKLFSGSIGTIMKVVNAIKLMGLEALKSGLNALRAGAMWLIEKARLVASTIATYAQAAAQWALNVAMDANPIMLVVLAIIALIAVLGYLYFNNEQVRQAIDNLGQTFMQIGQIIYQTAIWIKDMAISALQGLWEYITTLGGLLPEQLNITGNNIIDGIIAVMLFIGTLPLQIGMIFVNIIAKALGFGDNFVQNLFNAGVRSVSNFMGQIASLPSRLQSELNNMLSAVGRWAATLPQKFWDAGVNAVKNFLSALGIKSPGIMQRKLIAEMVNTGARIPEATQGIIRNVGVAGRKIVDSFGNREFVVNGKAVVSNEMTDYLDSLNDLANNNNISDGLVGYIDSLNNIELNTGVSDELSDYVKSLNGLMGYAQLSDNMIDANASLDKLQFNNLSSLLMQLTDALNNSNLSFEVSNEMTGYGNSVVENPFKNDVADKIINGLATIIKELVNNNGDTVINVYGDVDNDKRVKQILSAVRRELSWNNKTAGRTI